MAVTAVTPIVLDGVNKIKADALTFTQAASATDGFTVDVGKYADQKLLFFFQNTNSGSTVRTATIKAGNALQGVADLATGNVAALKTRRQ